MDNQINQLPCGFLSFNEDGTILKMNTELLEWLGYEQHELQGKHINLILNGSSKLFYQVYLFPLLKINKFVEEIYFSLQSKEAEDLPVLINGICHNSEGNLIYHCIIIRMNNRYKLEHELFLAKKAAEEAIYDLKKTKERLERMNAQLVKLATTDALTGLKNRRSFQEFLESTMLRSVSQQTPLSLLLVDIDHFKKINDTWGHARGDLVLQSASQIMKKCLRADDLIARIGGEEFAIILPDTEAKGALLLADHIRTNVAKQKCKDTAITVSIGISTLSANDTLSSLLNKADKALYQSKHLGRNRVTHYDLI